uniref:Uncharacterized protein n=1 Tax=Oryza punctata TaxID=4537 RepID=A0A0E0LUV7_ORYPU
MTYYMFAMLDANQKYPRNRVRAQSTAYPLPVRRATKSAPLSAVTAATRRERETDRRRSMGSRVAAEEADAAAAAALLTLQELAAAARRMEHVRVVPMEVEAPAARPPPPPPTRVQRLVAALRGRYSRGVDAVLYGFIGAVWVALVAGCVPMAVSRWVGVHGHTVAVVGGAVSWVSVRAMGVLALAFAPLFVLRGMDRGRAQVVEVHDELCRVRTKNCEDAAGLLQQTSKNLCYKSEWLAPKMDDK